MRAADYIDEILGAFRKQRLRTALTAIGIGIGAFAITLMVGLGQGLQTYIEDQFLAFENDRVPMVFPGSARFGERLLDRLNSLGRPAQRITEEHEDRRRMRRGGLWITPEQVRALHEVEGVTSVSPMTWLEVDGIALVDAPEEKAGFFETDFCALTTHPLVGRIIAGRLPKENGDNEIVLPPQYAASWDVAVNDLIGREVELRVPELSEITRRFLFRDPTEYREKYEVFRARVVGIAEKSPFSRSIYASIPLGRAMTRYQSNNDDLLSEDKIGYQVHVRIADDAEPVKVKEAIEALDLVARSMSDQFANVQKVFLLVDLVLTSFGLLAMLVATLGIANTLLMSITERTREIGVMKALGMTEQTIRRMFALEAASIGLVGGLCGTGFAVALGLIADALVKHYVPAAQNLEGYSVFHAPIWLLLGTVLFSSLVGGLAGIYPASRAGRLDPIKALHHE